MFGVSQFGHPTLGFRGSSTSFGLHVLPSVLRLELSSRAAKVSVANTSAREEFFHFEGVLILQSLNCLDCVCLVVSMVIVCGIVLIREYTLHRRI